MTRTKVEVTRDLPADFRLKAEVAACYCESHGKILFLKRADDDFEGGKWGVACGTVEDGETIFRGVLREVSEEAGIDLDPADVEKVGKLYIRQLNGDYIYHMFRAHFPHLPPVQLSHEHQDFCWATYEETLDLPLMSGARDALILYKKCRNDLERPKVIASSYLILRKDEQVLLLLRQNTGFEDGKYGLVSGHVEEGESALQAMVREAQEEAGIIVSPSEMKLAHIMHRRTHRINADFFFTCRSWRGDIVNREPGKCGELKFFPLRALPEETIGYVADVIQMAQEGTTYSERGW